MKLDVFDRPQNYLLLSRSNREVVGRGGGAMGVVGAGGGGVGKTIDGETDRGTSRQADDGRNNSQVKMDGGSGNDVATATTMVHRGDGDTDDNSEY